MVHFNFLSNEYKESLKKEFYSRILHILTVFSVFWALVFGTTLVAGVAFLSIQNNALEERIDSMQSLKGAQEAEEIEKNIADLNGLLLKIQGIKENKSHNVAAILSDIAPMVPEGSYISTFSFNSRTNIVLINGHANERIQVITLKDRFEESSLFAEVESPLSNLIQSNDIDFKFTLSLNDEE